MSLANEMLLLQERCFELDDRLRDVPSSAGEDRKRILFKFLEKAGCFNARLPLIDVGQDRSAWFNVDQPLTEAHFLGRIVVIDFFTYCCINCIHILPDLEMLEARAAAENHDDDVLVIGIHSAKFDNEKATAEQTAQSTLTDKTDVSENISDAIRRYSINHPVVNDAGAVWWRELGIACWPTLLILEPKSAKPIRLFVGEGHRDELLEFVDLALEYYKDDLESVTGKVPLPQVTSSLGEQLSFLRYPGKVCMINDDLLISDSGNHRLVISSADGVVRRVIGDGKRGMRDGTISEARFASPQGVCSVSENEIFVSDSENHAIRVIDLVAGRVSTVIGTGQQGKDLNGGSPGRDQAISSPWDLCLGHSPSNDRSGELDTLFIAMAGTHQIWAYALRDLTWWKNTPRAKGTCFRVVGSGREENRNNSYPDKAGFAQPSGIAYADSIHCLFVADSESSSIRVISLKDGVVKNVVGGSRDPSDLFAFGDNDGPGFDARLQHPMGVAFRPEDQSLIVADSYNHKVKRITAIEGKKAEIATLLTGFSEPGGVFVRGDDILIADTNNHSIKKASIKGGTCEKVLVSPAGPDTVDTSGEKLVARTNFAREVVRDVALARGQHEFTVSVTVSFVAPTKLNEEAPSSWKLSLLPAGFKCCQGVRGVFPGSHSLKFQVAAPVDFEDQEIREEIRAYLCNSENGVCFVKNYLVILRVALTDHREVETNVDVEIIID